MPDNITVGVKKKTKILYILKILSEETDDSHGITTPQLIQRLDGYGISAERKSIYSDINDLIDFGYDIVITGGRTSEYRLVSREFELAELKLLVDSVMSARFISEKKSKELIEKIEHFTSHRNAEKLNHQLHTFCSVKTENENVLINVDVINEAINQNKRLSFQYGNWNKEKKFVLRHMGQRYEISPLYLIWDNEYYYLVAFDHKDNIIKHFRVDKMVKLQIEAEYRINNFDNNMNIGRYSKRLFGMFDGEQYCVEIEATNEMVSILFDRLGKDIPIIKVDERHVKTVLDVYVSRQFLAWIIGLGENVKITGPDEVLEMMKAEINRLYKDYML